MQYVFSVVVFDLHSPTLIRSWCSMAHNVLYVNWIVNMLKMWLFFFKVSILNLKNSERSSFPKHPTSNALRLRCKWSSVSFWVSVLFDKNLSFYHINYYPNIFLLKLEILSSLFCFQKTFLLIYNYSKSTKFEK